jgi:hypothetical protein
LLPDQAWQAVQGLIEVGGAGLPHLARRLAAAAAAAATPSATSATAAHQLPVAWAALLAALHTCAGVDAAPRDSAGSNCHLLTSCALRVLEQSGGGDAMEAHQAGDLNADGGAGATTAAASTTDLAVWSNPGNVARLIKRLAPACQLLCTAPAEVADGGGGSGGRARTCHTLAALLGLALLELPQPLLPPQLTQLCNSLVRGVAVGYLKFAYASHLPGLPVPAW